MSRKDKRKKKKNRRFLRAVVIAFLILVAGTAGYIYYLLDSLDASPISKNDVALGIKKDVQNNEIASVTNIALFGVDRRSSSEKNTRSDSIMIASLDLKTKKIKLSSIMRDTYVDIPGRGMDKINHAYAYGGPELAIKTINQNFDMNIRDYVMVDFDGLKDIIDGVGGVEIDIEDYEVSRSNVSAPGLQTLNGDQALAYSRIRYAGNGDFERTERQRTVLEQLIHKILNQGMTQYPKTFTSLLPYVETSLGKGQMLSLGTKAITSGVSSIDQYRIPVDGHAKGQKINGVYYLVPQDLKTNVDFLHQFIYEIDTLVENNQ